jgi:hypothetical protein
MQNPFRYFNSSPAIIRLAVMMYVRFPLSLRQVEDLLSERGIEICHDGTVLVEPVRSAVCSGDPEALDSSSFALELARIIIGLFLLSRK